MTTDYALVEHCPRCDSPAPNLHPAMQHEGEVQPCSHPWHDQPFPRSAPSSRAATHQRRRVAAAEAIDIPQGFG